MSSEPHLHIHHQRQDPNKILLLAEGLPLFFQDIEESCMPRGGREILINGVRVVPRWRNDNSYSLKGTSWSHS